MSKLTDKLRLLRIFNNWELMKRFANGYDVAVTYHAKPKGRMGFAEANRTTVWSTLNNKRLPMSERALINYREKVFYGKRSESLPAAIEWAKSEFGYEFVPSPFGGLIPERVLDKAKTAVKRMS